MQQRQLFDLESSTFTYLLADRETGDAVIIDPVIGQFERDRTLVEELDLHLRYVLDTHVHADHVTGSGLLRERFHAPVVISERAGVVCADWQVKHGDRIRFGSHELEVRETPGHTNGCLSFLCSAARLAFTGDALLIRGCGRTDFQEGDAATLYRSVHEQLLSLPDDTQLFPAHDYKGRNVTSVAEEKRWNPRLGGTRTLAQFVDIMHDLKLAYPSKIDVAVPLNLQCGMRREPDQRPSALDLGWAPIDTTVAGVPEVTAEWLERVLSGGNEPGVVVVDVRESDEYFGELGHIHEAHLMPIATVANAVRDIPPTTPIVTVCRSGGRSGKAALALAKLGWQRVASMRGGMREWRARQLPVERGHVSSRQG